MSTEDKTIPTTNSKYNHTEKITERRKALFPTTEEPSDDLGHMSPLYSSDSNSNFSDIHALDNLEIELNTNCTTFFKHNLNDYILLNRDAEEKIINLTPSRSFRSKPGNFHSECNMSPLYLSPMHKLLSSPLLYSPQQTTAPLTPLGKSPTSTLKTPNDTSTVKVNVKNQKRKLQDINLNAMENDKFESPLSKNPKLETASKSKVRTALFPEVDISVPTQSFYPKTCAKIEKYLQVVPTSEKVPKRKYICSKRNSKRKYGQINAGVMHKIKKPKQKKPSKVQLMKAAMNILDNSALNQYLSEIASLNAGSLTKQITRIEETQSPEIIKTCDKENIAEEEPEVTVPTNKRFFKSKLNRGIVTISKNIRINVENGKLNLLKRPLGEHNSIKSKVIETVITTPLDDLNDSNEVTIDTDINKILNVLEEENNPKKKKPTPLDTEDLILSPTSQMCDMASGLAINSPKRAKININSILDKVGNANTTIFNHPSLEMEQQKLFPIFCGGSRPITKTKSAEVQDVAPKKWKVLPPGQTFLDAGQKSFGMTQCSECQIVYHMGDPSDEYMHSKYHNSTHVLKFQGWKNERVVSDFMDGRIIRIVPGDSKLWWKKVKDLSNVINTDLGYYDDVFPVDHYQIYLYIKNKQIAGCLMAEEKSIGYKMLECSSVDICSEESYRIRCGVSRIWVSKNFRKTGIATSLLNVLRSTFVYGMILQKHDIAISAPTDMGKAFAKKYFQTENFLIYMT